MGISVGGWHCWSDQGELPRGYVAASGGQTWSSRPPPDYQEPSVAPEPPTYSGRFPRFHAATQRLRRLFE